MNDNYDDNLSSRLVRTPAEVADPAADAEGVDLRLREFFRRAALALVIVPSVGAITQAADENKKHKAKPAAKTAQQPTTKTSSASSHSTASKQAHPAAKAGATRKSRASSLEIKSPLARNSDQIARTSPSVGGNVATPSSSMVNGGTPLPEIYKDWNLRNFEQIQSDENAHVAFLVNALGAYARPTPIFQSLEQSTVHEFAELARAFENTGVGAYLGALPVLASTAAGQQYLGAAGSIALIEARHAGYLNSLIDLSISENITGNVANFDSPLTPDQVVTLVSPFVVSLNGGPPLIPAGGLTNALDILNFALALEYLEAAFYNINVPNLARTLAR
jgi:hypothetical protein